MEVYARELIPALAAARRAAPHRVRQPRGRRGDGPWGAIVPMVVVPVHARNRVEWVRGEQQHLPGAGRPRRLRRRALPRLDGAAARPRPRASRRSTTSTTSSSRRRTSALRGLGMRRARAGRRAALAPRDRRRRVDRARPRRAPARAGGQDRRRAAGPAAPPARGGRRRRRAAPRASGSASGPSCSQRSARKRPHKNLARLLDALAGIPRRAPAGARRPGLPDPARGRAARAGRRGSASTATSCWPAWLAGRGPRGPLRAGRRASSSPRCYEGFGLPVLEAMARGVPGRLLGPLVARPRSRATRRCSSTPRTPGAIRRRSSACCADAAAARAPRAPRARAGGRLHLGADGRADRREPTSARCPSARRPRPPAQRALEAQPLGVARRTTRRSTSRSARPPRGRAGSRRPSSSGEARRRRTPLTPSSTSSTAALSVAAHDDRRRALARWPRRRPCRSPRGCEGRTMHERARAARASSTSWSTKPGRVDDARAARRVVDGALDCAALGAVAEDDAGSSGAPRRARARPRAAPRARASRGCGARRRRRPARRRWARAA